MSMHRNVSLREREPQPTTDTLYMGDGIESDRIPTTQTKERDEDSLQ